MKKSLFLKEQTFYFTYLLWLFSGKSWTDEQGKEVRILYGTAAVYAESVSKR